MQGLVDQLDAGYQEVMGLYGQLLALAKSMAQSLEAGQWETIDAQLGEKQVIIDTIGAKEGELAEVREKLREELGLETFSLEQLRSRLPITELSNTMAQLMEVLQELEEWERNNEEILRKLVAGVQSQLEDFGRSKRASKEYLPRSAIRDEARFVDEKK